MRRHPNLAFGKLEFAVSKGFDAKELGFFTKLFFDTKELVVFGHTVGTGSGTSLDLSGVDGDGEVGDGSIFGFARTVGDRKSVV